MKQCSLNIDLNEEFKKANDNMITIQLNFNKVEINYFQLYKYSRLFQEKNQISQEQLSQKIQEFKEKFDLIDENIIIFFKILQDEKVEIKNDSLLDLFILSILLKVELLQKNLQKSLPNFQHIIVNILTYLIEKNDEIKIDDIEDDNSLIKSILNVEMEKCLTNKINEIITNKLFKKLPKCIIYRILERSDPQNIPCNDLFSFIMDLLDERYVFFAFLDIKNLTKENFDNLVATYLNLKDSRSKIYFQHLSVDLDYIKSLKENEESIQIKLDNKTKEYNDNLNKYQDQIQNLENDKNDLLIKIEKLENDNKQLLIQVENLINGINNLEKENLENGINDLQNNINVKQLVYFLIDRSGSMGARFDQSHNRLDVSTKFVCEFVKRSKELNVSSFFGFSFFNHEKPIICELTQNVENFLIQINNYNKRPYGGTALFRSIKDATDLLIKVHQKNQYPNATLRLIIISDGEDVYSNKKEKSDILNYAILNNIRIDTILITSEKLNDVILLSEKTGCASFSPKNIDDGIDFINQEAFIDPSKRIFKNHLPKLTVNDFVKYHSHKDLNPEIIVKK